MASLRVDTQAILQAADAFEQLYARAEETIGAMDAQWRSEINVAWVGPAGEQAQEAYAAFREKYFARYLQMLRNYQQFLRETAAGGYEQTESGNVELSDLIAEDVGMCPESEATGFMDKFRDNKIITFLK